jgi:ABC-2 type transport system permease protein
MNLRRTRAMARKEFFHIIRDPRSLGMGIAIPMLMLFLYGYALTLDVKNVPTVVWDQSQSRVSREFISRFNGSPYFSLREYADNYRDVEYSIDSSHALVALIIPRDFARQVKTGRPASVQLIVDGSDSATATIAMGYATSITQGYSQDMLINRISRIANRNIRMPIDLRPRVWFNTDMESKNFIVPGLIAVIMMVIAAILTSLTVAREWENGTMEQLISTPVKTEEMIIGKLIPYFGVGMLDVSLAVLMSTVWFKVPFRGSMILLFGLAAIFLVGTLSLGLLISIVTKNQFVANQLAMTVTLLPSFLLSGFTFAISNMPKPLQLITYAVPTRYFVSILKGIYLKGIGLKVLWFEVLLLTIFTLVNLALANRKLKKKLE